MFGARVAVDVGARQSSANGDVYVPEESMQLPVVAGPVLQDLRSIMWNRVGLVRTGSGLWEARNAILEIEPVLRRTLAGRNAVDMALMMVMASLRRSESRGGHYRADYPEPDPMQAHRTLIDPGVVKSVRVAA